MQWQDETFSVHAKCLLLRLNRLGHLPGAAYAAEILQENGYPILAVEFGAIHEPHSRVFGNIPKLRLQATWVGLIPRRARPLAILLNALFHLVQLIREQGRPNLIISHGLQENWVALVLHLLFRIPFVVHVHEIYDSCELRGLNRLCFMFEGAALRQAEFLIFSESTRSKIYQERYRLTSPIWVAYSCPRLRTQRKRVDLRLRHRLPASAQLMLYLGGIGKCNGLEKAVEALVDLPGVYFLLVGWSDEKTKAVLTRIAREHGVSSRLIWVGQVENKWEYIDNCDIAYCVYDSTHLRTRHVATASNKLMEAISAAIPVLAVEREDFGEIVRKHEVGLCIRDVSVTAIADGVLRLLSNPIRLRRMSRNALRLHRQSFHYEAQFGDILCAIDSMPVFQKQLRASVSTRMSGF